MKDPKQASGLLIFGYFSVFYIKSLGVPFRLVTFVAVHGLIAVRFKRYFGGFAAFRADCIVHNALAAIAIPALLPAVVPAFPAACGFVFKTLFLIKFLFASGEHEFFAAIFADQYFVFEHLV